MISQCFLISYPEKFVVLRNRIYHQGLSLNGILEERIRQEQALK